MNHQSHKRFKYAFDLWLALGAALLCISADLFLPEPFNLGFASVAFLLYSIWKSVEEARRAPLIFDPLSVMHLCQTVTLGVVPLILSVEYAGMSIPFSNWEVPFSDVAVGHAILVLGAISFCQGMAQFRPPSSLTDAVPIPLTAMEYAIALLVGTGFHLFRFSLTPLLGSAVVTFSKLPLAVLCVVALNPPRMLRTRNQQLAVLAIGTIYLIALSARADSKLELVLSFLPIIWWLLSRKRIAAASMTICSIVIAYISVIHPVVTAMRNSSIRTEENTRSLMATGMWDFALEQLRSSRFVSGSENERNSLENTLQRMAPPVAAGLVYGFARDRGFLYGEKWYDLIYAFVPRIIWPDKPSIDRGREFTAYLGWAYDAESAATSTGESSAGELYWNFGWFGVLVGMSILGIGVALLMWRPAGSDPRHGVLQMMIYCSVMLNAPIILEGAASPLVVGCITYGVFFRIVLRLSSLWSIGRGNRITQLKFSPSSSTRGAGNSAVSQ